MPGIGNAMVCLSACLRGAYKSVGFGEGVRQIVNCQEPAPGKLTDLPVLLLISQVSKSDLLNPGISFLICKIRVITSLPHRVGVPIPRANYVQSLALSFI